MSAVTEAAVTTTTSTAAAAAASVGNFNHIDAEWYVKSAVTFGALSGLAAVLSLFPVVFRWIHGRRQRQLQQQQQQQQLSMFCLRCCCRCYAPVARSKEHSDDAKSPVGGLALARVTTAGYTLWWFSLSIGFTVYNKWLLNDWQGGSDFPATFSMLHMLLKGVFAATAIKVTCRPVYRISLRDFLLLACPIGLSTGMDVVLANISLVIVTMSFYTLVKSTTLLFILAMVLCFRLDRFSWWLVVVCVVLVAGLVMTSFGETQFEFLGLTMAVISMVFGGLRWVLSEALLHDKRLCVGAKPLASTGVESKRIAQNQGTPSSSQPVRAVRAIDPLNLVMLIAPASFITIVPFVVLDELPSLIAKYNETYSPPTANDTESGATPIEFLAVSAIGGVLAFLLILVEIVLVQVTSSLTLSVLGVLKTLVQVLIAIFLFGDDLGLLKAFGMVVTLSGLLGYAFFKNWRNQQDLLNASSLVTEADSEPTEIELVAVGTRRNKHIPRTVDAKVSIDMSDSSDECSSSASSSGDEAGQSTMATPQGPSLGTPEAAQKDE